MIEFDIMYGEGISKMGEILDLGVKAGVVDKSGSWFSYNSERIGQGRENAKSFLRDNPTMSNAIEAQIRQNSGLVSEVMLTGGPDDGTDGASDDKDSSELPGLDASKE
jgi:recombination protein RecA